VVTGQAADAIYRDATFDVDVTQLGNMMQVIPSLHIFKILPNGGVYSLVYGLSKVVTCQAAAPINHNATLDVDVTQDNDACDSISAYF